jgi:hypothetical protein
MFLEVEGIVGMLLNNLEDLDRFGDNLNILVSGCGENARMLPLPQGRHHHLGAH